MIGIRALRPVASAFVCVAAVSALSAPANADTASETRGRLSATMSLPTLLPDAARGVGLRYTTRDERGRPATATGQVLLPRGTPPAGGWPVVSWAKGTVGIDSTCGVTATEGSGRPAPLAVALARPFLSSLLRRGVAVVSSDYIGLGPDTGTHHYLAAHAEANAVVDIVRASRAVAPLAQRWVAAGHSQGGQAVLTVGAERRPDPSVGDLRGVVAFAPASNVELALSRLGPTTPRVPALNSLTTTLLYVLHGLRDARPDLPVNDLLTPRGRALLDAAPRLCIEQMRAATRDVAPRDVLARPLSGPVGDAVADLVRVPTRLSSPATIIHGTADTVAPFAASVLLTGQIAATRADVRLLPRTGVDHYVIVDDATTLGTETVADLLR